MLCNNCGKPTKLNEKDYIFVHQNGRFWCDSTKTKGVDVTDPREYALNSNGFTILTERDGKACRYNYKTKDYIFISRDNKPLNHPHNQEIYLKYGIKLS